MERGRSQNEKNGGTRPNGKPRAANGKPKGRKVKGAEGQLVTQRLRKGNSIAGKRGGNRGERSEATGSVMAASLNFAIGGWIHLPGPKTVRIWFRGCLFYRPSLVLTVLYSDGRRPDQPRPK